MTDEQVERTFRQHPAFETVEAGEFESTTTPFDGTVTTDEADECDGAREYHVVVRTPALDAVVEGETVAGVVEDGWFETLELRLSDAHTVTQTDDTALPEIRREGGEVVVSLDFVRSDPELAAEDAQAVVEYVEGTWVQGVIPGYDYGEPAAGLLERATQNYDEDGENRGDGPSGAPPL